jgi:hypothetical protein
VIAFAATVLLIGGGVVGFRITVGILRDKVVKALGPGSEIAALRVGWSTVEVEGLRIQAGPGWPATDSLRAERVVITPSVRTLLSDQVRVRSVTVTRPYLSALRTRDGQLQVIPGLLGSRAGHERAGTVAISDITIEDGMVDLFDATVSQPPLKIRLEQVHATVGEVVAPTLMGKSRFDMTAVVKGVQRDGRVQISGWAEVATRDSSVRMVLQSVDLVALQPYLVRATETRVQKGTLDLELDSEVRKHHLRAPGRIVISDLEFAPARGAWDTFMGLPRGAVVNSLKSKGNKIEVNFVLEGDLDNPHFALNEAFATRVAVATAERLGVSIQGVVEGLGSLGREGLEASSEAAQGAGEAVRELLGGRRKP